MKKITYRTGYDTTNRICGYVLAEERHNFTYGDFYVINRRQYNRCLEKRSIGGCAGVIFDADCKFVFIEERSGDLSIIQTGHCC